MIRLTSHENGSHFYVNPEQIRAINFKDGATQVWMGTISASATESPQEVARKVLEWRLLISKYDSLRNAIAQEWGKGSQEQLICEVELVKISLYKLAGLEEPT